MGACRRFETRGSDNPICRNPLVYQSEQSELVDRVIKTAGDKSKLLELFRFGERVLNANTPAALVTQDEKGNRASVVKVADDWWIGTAKREKDQVRVLCWAWSLRILLNPNARIRLVPDVKLNDKTVFGLRVTGAFKELIDLSFDKESNRLVAIDYDDTRYIFSVWKETNDGR